MIGKYFDIDSYDKYLYKHMVPFPNTTSEERVKCLQRHSIGDNNNNCVRSWCNSKVVIMMSMCLFVWCGLMVLALPTLSGVGSLTFDAASDPRAEAAHHDNARPGKNPKDGSTDDDRFTAIESLVFDLETRIQELDKRNRDLELAVIVERTKPQEDAKLEQLVDQLERGLEFLFPDFKEGTLEATRLSPEERATGERMMVLRDYLGNREAELAALRPDLVPELGRGHDAAAPDLGTIGLALQQLSNEHAEMRRKMEEMARRMAFPSGGRQGGDTDGDMENIVREVVEDDEDRYMDESERGRAADTRKSAFSVASSQPQLGLQGQMQYVTFDHNISNKGEDFNFDNNSFVCRIPGFYFFTFTMRTYDHRFLGIVLMKDDDPQVAINTDQSDRSISSTQTTILRLSEGDSVWLRMPPSENYGIYSDGAHYTTFTGFLVFSTST